MGNESYTTVGEALRAVINKAQYFGPLFSWLAIVYTYFEIGYKKGKVWKYLLYISTLGYIASFINVIYTLADSLNYKYDTYLKLLWVEGFLWTINEWGYIYINYIKIRTYIKKLRSKKWSFFIYTVLFYALFIRIFLSKIGYDEKRRLHYKLGSDEDKEKYDKKDSIFNSLMYFPLGIACFCFIFLILEELHNETDKYTHNVISSLLDSTLSRMLFVSLIFLGMSIIVVFPNKGFYAWVRKLLWRTKGYIGIIILSDLLLLRIDLNDNSIIMKNERIEKMKKAKTPEANRKLSLNSEYNLFEVNQANSIFSENMSYHGSSNNYNGYNINNYNMNNYNMNNYNMNNYNMNNYNINNYNMNNYNINNYMNYNNYDDDNNYENLLSSPESEQNNLLLRKYSESILSKKSNNRERRKSTISNYSGKRNSIVSSISARRKSNYSNIIPITTSSIINENNLGGNKKRKSKSSISSPLLAHGNYGPNAFKYNKLESPIAISPSSGSNTPTIEMERKAPGNISIGTSFGYKYTQ